jgi:hypothetical protein
VDTTTAPIAVLRNIADIVTPSAGCSANPFGQFAVVQARHGYTWTTAHEGHKPALAAVLAAAAERLPDLLAMRRAVFEESKAQ